ncbi:MAG: MFS transporter [Dehalococcoidia bacterium]|nr:MFS transporter [Dehalococcoidia bacterium]
MNPLQAFISDYVVKTRQFSRNAKLYVLHVIGMDMIHGSWTVLFNLYLLAIGFDIKFIGLRLVVEGIARAVTAIPAGLVSDRVGRKASFILGDGIGALFGLVMISTRNEALLLAIPALGAFFGNLHHTAEPAFMAENSKSAERVHLFAVAGSLRTFSAMTGALIAGLVPALFVDSVGLVDAYRYATYAGLALWFLSLIPAVMLRSLEAEERPEEQFARGDALDAPGSLDRSGGVRRLSLRRLTAGITHPRRIAFFVLTSAFLSFGFGAIGPLINVAFHEGHVHAGETELGVMFAVGELGLAAATLLVPLLAARMLKVDAIVLTRLLALPFVFAMGVLPVVMGEGQVLLLLVGASYVGRVTMFRMSSPLDDAFNMDVLDARERATNTGFEIAVGGALSALAVFIGSRLLDSGDCMTPFLIMGVCFAISTLIYWRAFRPLELSELRAQAAVAGGGK